MNDAYKLRDYYAKLFMIEFLSKIVKCNYLMLFLLTSSKHNV